MKKIALVTSLIFGTIFTSFSQINKDNQLKQASESVLIWTNNLKTGKYQEVYSGLSPENKAIYDSIEWVNAIDQMMDPFGDLLDRKEISKKFTDSIAESESGYYVIFKYKCNYKNTSNHYEEIIMKQDNKKRWKVFLFSYDFIGGENYIE